MISQFENEIKSGDKERRLKSRLKAAPGVDLRRHSTKMRDTEVEIWVHLVWSTWDRAPLITPEIEKSLHRNLVAQAQHHGCKVLAIGGVDDHIHLLVSLPPTLPIAQLVKQLKGVSSNFINHELTSNTPFKWQGSYGAFSVSRWDVRKIIDYIQKQKEHHSSQTLISQLEWDKNVSTCVDTRRQP
jgi:REP element-mobilizing transposase RayT